MLQAAFYKGPAKSPISRIIRFWTRSHYSHCELIFSDGVAASADLSDRGVRFKQPGEIDFNPDHWDFITLPDVLEAPARQWFTDHNGASYDIVGNLHFVIDPVPDDDKKWFCSEAMGTALGILLQGAGRFSPGDLYFVLEYMARIAKHHLQLTEIAIEPMAA